MKNCVFCGKSLRYGNNAMPIMEGYCCDECNFAFVIPERMKKSQEVPEPEVFDDLMIVSDLSGIAWGRKSKYL